MAGHGRGVRRGVLGEREGEREGMGPTGIVLRQCELSLLFVINLLFKVS